MILFGLISFYNVYIDEDMAVSRYPRSGPVLVMVLVFFFKLKNFLNIIGRFVPNPDPLLSASNKSGQKCLSAHFAISNNVSLRSPLVKFEAEPNPWDRFSAIWQMKNFSALFEPFFQPQPPAPSQTTLPISSGSPLIKGEKGKGRMNKKLSRFIGRF